MEIKRGENNLPRVVGISVGADDVCGDVVDGGSGNRPGIGSRDNRGDASGGDMGNAAIGAVVGGADATCTGEQASHLVDSVGFGEIADVAHGVDIVDRAAFATGAARFGGCSAIASHDLADELG